MRYFAYGANMCTAHFKRQVPDAQVIGAAKLPGYQIFFHKLGNQDGSGKCNIVACKDPDKAVYGVLYDISSRSRYLLDKAERLGYGNHDVTLKLYALDCKKEEHKEGQYAFTYIAHKERIRDDLLPYIWYKDLVIAGANEHHLPDTYINHLESYAAIPDPKQTNPRSESRILVPGLVP